MDPLGTRILNEIKTMDTQKQVELCKKLISTFPQGQQKEILDYIKNLRTPAADSQIGKEEKAEKEAFEKRLEKDDEGHREKTTPIYKKAK